MPATLEDRWDHCKTRIRNQLASEDASAWLPSLRLIGLQPGRIELGGIPNSFFKNRIAARYQGVILEAVRSEFPDISFQDGPSLELTVEASPAETTLTGWIRQGTGDAAEESPRGNHTGELDEGHNGDARRLCPHFLFANFLVDEENRSAFQFARQVAAEPGRQFNPFLLTGSTGIGKTHLLQAVANELMQTHSLSVIYRTGEEFKNEVLDGITRRRMRKFRDLYRSADALVLDDLHFLLVSPRAQEELLHTLDGLHRAGRQLVISCNRFPRELLNLSDALGSRLEMGLVAEMGAPGPEIRKEIALARANRDGIQLPSEVAGLLAARISRSLRQLEGAVVRLGAYSNLQRQPITCGFAEATAAPFFDAADGGNGIPVSREQILERVADRFGVTIRSLKGRGRSPHLLSARRVAIHLLKTRGECSYPEIGALLGNRTHSTMVHSHQTLIREMEGNVHLKKQVMKLVLSMVD